MKELKPRIHENGIDYILVGDYYVPDWKLPEEHRPIGRWGNLHRAYLRQFCPALYSTLVLSGELHTYLADLNEQATERCSLTMLPIYLIHLFVGMSFGKGASVGLGIAGSLIAALMITGLGDATWKYIPWAWGVRAMDYTVLAWDSPQLYAQVKPIFQRYDYFCMLHCLSADCQFGLVSWLGGR